ncbi:TIGR02444 family protein [Roseiarcaceae bacterium H3SJ34-1]|uniref:TIGR02444 family protein n=1 Tax=Terripilifer ovatus TaxID=3032367 RepID=UPI003AB98B3D|nr:TIGR02444 family protein [Roseiarcaceae bacterium H3SJ34-1]
MQKTTSPFWTFSLSFYRMDGVAPACIEVQDKAGVDVNILLFVLFLATRGRALQTADVAAIDAALKGWRDDVVIPLRAVRRVLRSPEKSVDPEQASALRERIKAVELEAERLQQEALYALRPLEAWGAAQAPEPAARANVAAYAAWLDADLPAAAIKTMLRQLPRVQVT